jgi:hypothetical protein
MFTSREDRSLTRVPRQTAGARDESQSVTGLTNWDLFFLDARTYPGNIFHFPEARFWTSLIPLPGSRDSAPTAISNAFPWPTAHCRDFSATTAWQKRQLTGLEPASKMSTAKNPGKLPSEALTKLPPQ